MLTVNYIKIQLLTDKRWLERGILAIYNKQTADEQRCEETKEDNGVGFSGSDARIFSSFAKQIKGGRTLSEKQVAQAQARMPKYSKQLLKIANKEI